MDVVEVAGETCDQCGPAVQAWVFASFKVGSLALCGHCATVGWDELNRQAVKVIDHRKHIPGATCEPSSE